MTSRRTASSAPAALRVLTTYPRSGTHWLKGMLSAALEIPPLEARLEDPVALGEALDRDGGTALIYEHLRYSQHGAVVTAPRALPLQLIVLDRHPFDQIISQLSKMISEGFAPPASGSPQEVARAFVLGELDSELGYDWPDFFCREYDDRVLDWLGPPHALRVRYDDLVAEPEKELGRCLDHFGVADVDPATIVPNFSFESLSGGRSPGEMDESSHYRRGLAGEWRRVFQRSDADRLRRLYHDTFDRLGYSLEIE